MQIPSFKIPSCVKELQAQPHSIGDKLRADSALCWIFSCSLFLFPTQLIGRREGAEKSSLTFKVLSLILDTQGSLSVLLKLPPAAVSGGAQTEAQPCPGARSRRAPPGPIPTDGAGGTSRGGNRGSNPGPVLPDT